MKSHAVPSAQVTGGRVRANQHAHRDHVVDIDLAVAVDVAEDRRHGAQQAEHLVADGHHVLHVDHPVVVHVARQDVEAAGEGGDQVVADGDGDPIGRVDRLGQGDRVARPRAGNGHRPVVHAAGANDRDVAGGQRRGLGEGDLELVDPQPGQVGVPAGRQQAQSVAGGLERGGLRPPVDGDRVIVIGPRRRRCRPLPLTIRGKPVPRWSVVKGRPVWDQRPGRCCRRRWRDCRAARAMVWVGPPLFCSPRGSRPGLATPTWLPLRR